MNKEMLNSWIAKAGEHKIAIGVAAVCSVAILGSLLWPNPKPQPPISEVKTAAPAAPAFSPAAPTQQPAPTAVAPTPQPVPAAPASAPAPAAPSTMQKELEAKPLFPSSSQAPAPKPAAPAPQAKSKPKPMPPAPKPAPVSKPAAPTAAPARTTPPRPVPVARIPSGYYVQLGSYKIKKGAAELAKKAASRHWSVYVAPRPGGLHAVWIGPYRTRAEVDRAKQQLRKDMGISGFVVQSR